MKLGRLTRIAAVLAPLGAMSCLPSTAEKAGNPDGASFDGPPVAVAPNIAAWAIEIAPPPRSGAQLTELPYGSATPVITAGAEFELTVPFRGSASVGANLPTSASAIVTVPSRIPGRPDLAFQGRLELGTTNAMTGLTNATARVNLPDALRGQMGTVSLVPLPPSDEKTPPYTFPVPIPMVGMPFAILDLPTNARTLRGLVRDSLDNPKTLFTARAFQNGVLVSTTPTTAATATNPAGNFVLLLPGDTPGDGITLELVPMSGTSDPWVTYSGLSLTQQNTDLGAISLPAALTTTPFQATVHGGNAGGTPVPGATVRAHTTLPGGDTRVSATFAREGVSDAGGTVNMSLMPGTTNNPRPYTVSVVPPAGSIWATQCFDNVPAQWSGGAPVTLLLDVTLPRRAVITGNVMSASGGPVGSVAVTAIAMGAMPPLPNCLVGPAITSATTDAMGSFTLPLDPGTYQLEYDPPAGSPFPRIIESLEVTPAEANRTILVRLPAPVLVEGDVLKAPGIPLPNAIVRLFERRINCRPTDPCAPWLRATTQTDANGHFRAIAAMPATN
jgi:hypothetical protein